MQDTVRDWARAAGVRAVKTAAQAAVSDNAVDVSALSDAIAELSQLVSDLTSKEA